MLSGMTSRARVSGQACAPLKGRRSRSDSVCGPRVRTILIIEGNGAGRDELREVLELEGCTVVVAAHREDALSAMRREHPDLILCDVRAGTPDGFAVLAALRADAALGAAPFFLLSPRRDAGELQRAIDLEADGYFGEPYETAALLAAMNAHLSHE